MRNIRVWFEKHEQAKYISHLDLNRYMPRAIRRAKIPAWYTEGFNKHLYINFALPLSMGFESRNDCFEIRIVDDEFTDGQVLENLSNAMPLGIKITKITDSLTPYKNIAFAEYNILLDYPSKDINNISRFFENDVINVVKKSKRGEKNINLKEIIKRIYFKEADNKVLINVILPAGCTDNINPTLLLQAISDEFNCEIDYLRIIRNCFYTSDLNVFK